jgi:hypothetical protein
MPTTLSALYALSLIDLKKKARTVYHVYRKYWERDESTRDTWLENLAKARTTHKHQQRRDQRKGRVKRTKQNTQTHQQRMAAQIRILRKEEGTRRFFGRIKRAIGPDQFAGISMVIAQDSEGNWKQQTKHADITKALIQEHTRKYQQTVGTPPMRAPILQQI